MDGKNSKINSGPDPGVRGLYPDVNSDALVHIVKKISLFDIRLLVCWCDSMAHYYLKFANFCYTPIVL